MVKNIALILIAVIFAVSYLRYFEHKALYFPTSEIEYLPTVIGLSYEDVYIDTDDGIKLHTWFIPATDSKYTLLFCHGNGGNISHRIEKLDILNKLGLDIFIFDYRGYGKSSGRPSEKGFYKDVEAMYNYLVSKRRIEPKDIILYGESLGGAVAIELATKRKPKALITEASFSSTKDVAKELYPLFPTFIIWSKFDSLSKIKNITIPKLIIHSQNDDIIPFSHSLKLLEASPEPKRHLVLTGSHNDFFIDSRDLYASGIRDFLKGL